MREPIKQKFDLLACVNATSIAQHYLDRYQRVLADADRKIRLDAAECRMCYQGYGGSRIGGAMCTNALCGSCGVEMRFGSTAIDRLCLECAKRLGVCKRCGADLNDKIRRKLEKE